MKLVGVAAWAVRVGLAVALLAIAWVAARPVVPPEIVPASAPETAFSAERAMRELRVVAREPHPAGSAAQAQVRDYIVEQAATLGLHAEVQRRRGVESLWTDWVGTVENVIVRVPGTNPTGDVLITAHYDSFPGAPGAADDGVSIAAMLETMRALAAGPPLRNDVVFLFTDAEERGWLGAKGFVERHPAARRVGVTLAFEGWPSGGPTVLRATTPGDAWVVRELVAASPGAWANSATNTSERLHHGSDFGELADAGLVGAEFENPGTATRHHRPGDRVEVLDPRLLQDHGEVMLTLARHFGELDLSGGRTGDDLVFFTLPGLGMVAYPTWLATIPAIVAAGLLVAVIVAARQRGDLTLARVVWGALAFLGMLLVGAALATGVWELLLSAHSGAEELSYPDFEGSAVAMVAILVVAAAAFLAVVLALSRRMGVVELVAGVLLVWLLVNLGFSLANPLASTLIVWPFLGGVGGLAVVLFVRGGAWAAALLVLTAAPTLMFVVPLLVLETLKPDDGPGVAVLFLVLLLGLMVPQLALITGRLAVKAD
jgi:peptidase M28-like protein